MRRKSTSYCPPWMSPMLMALMRFLQSWNAETHCCKYHSLDYYTLICLCALAMSLVSGGNLWFHQILSQLIMKTFPTITETYLPLSMLSKCWKDMHKLFVEHLSTHHPLSNSQWEFFEGKPIATAQLSPHYYS